MKFLRKLCALNLRCYFLSHRLVISRWLTQVPQTSVLSLRPDRKYQFCFIFIPDIELNAKRPYITTACQIFTAYFYWKRALSMVISQVQFLGREWRQLR